MKGMVRRECCIGKERKWLYIAQITNGTRSPELVSVSLIDEPAEGSDLQVTSVAARFFSNTVRTMAQMPELYIINKDLEGTKTWPCHFDLQRELTRNPYPSERKYRL